MSCMQVHHILSSAARYFLDFMFYTQPFYTYTPSLLATITASASSVQVSNKHFTFRSKQVKICCNAF